MYEACRGFQSVFGEARERAMRCHASQLSVFEHFAGGSVGDFLEKTANESYRVQMERYRAGASTISDVIDASAEQLRAQLDLVNSAIDARVQWVRLQRRIGEP